MLRGLFFAPKHDHKPVSSGPLRASSPHLCYNRRMQTREERLARQRAYYHANRERLNARKYERRRTEHGRALRREQGQRYYQKHREEILARKSSSPKMEKARAWWAANKDRINEQRRVYRLAHPDEARAQDAVKRARKRARKGGQDPSSAV